MTKNKTLILGIGNNILTDDGIGSRLTGDLISMINHPDIEFNYACCGGLEIVEYIKDYGKVIFIDAIRTAEGKPGDVYYFVPSDFRETSHLSSLHDISFLTALKLSDNLSPGLHVDLHIIAVEIIEDMEFSEELTPQLNEKYPDILQQVHKIVKGIIG